MKLKLEFEIVDLNVLIKFQAKYQQRNKRI